MLILIFSLFLFPLSMSTQGNATCDLSEPGSKWFYLLNITYYSTVIYSTPAHMAVKYGDLTFDFYNLAVPYTAKCSGTGTIPYEFFYGTETYDCSIDWVPNTGTATFNYNRTSGLLSVEQTWLCGRLVFSNEKDFRG